MAGDEHPSAADWNDWAQAGPAPDYAHDEAWIAAHVGDESYFQYAAGADAESASDAAAGEDASADEVWIGE